MELKISYCPKLLSSTNEKFPLPPSIQELQIECLPTRLQPYFPENQTSLKNMVVGPSPDLQSLRLHSFTALEVLEIYNCGQLDVLEGLPYLNSLRRLCIQMNPKLSAAWVRKCQDQEGRTHVLLPRSLEILCIKALQDETVPYLLAHLPALVQLEVCDSPNLTSLPLDSLAALKRVIINSCDSFSFLEGLLSELEVSDSPNLTSLQLGSLRALKKLDVLFCKSLVSLEGLQSLGSLTDLTILGCYSITPCLDLMSQQAVGFNLFHRLERIKIDDFSALTTSFCKHLTSVQHLVLLEDSNIKRAYLQMNKRKHFSSSRLCESSSLFTARISYIFLLCYTDYLPSRNYSSRNVHASQGFLRRAFHPHWKS
ncbi:uncharacterized protein LOC120688549 [Panicum virgatum]|uniref:uncharacterized protein LOC120688549 n=1 Tax=Panicum virgatum TaxID=38727 RepID=UPI0019D4FC8A|nr:uncharacterized protein LOC120688549 [Panicum virgatum]